jgi:peptide chain release factor 2
MDPNFWEDAARAKKIQQQRGRIQEALYVWNSCVSTLDEAGLLLELAMEEGDAEATLEVDSVLGQLEKRIAAFELECMFSGEHDGSNAIVAINAGAGGTEAQDWVSMLMRMYLRWAEDNCPGDEAASRA